MGKNKKSQPGLAAMAGAAVGDEGRSPQSEPASTNDTPAAGGEARSAEAEPASENDAPAKKLKTARHVLREHLAFFLDLQIPGHGEKQSQNVLQAIDDLILARLAAGPDAGEPCDLDAIIGEHLAAAIEPLRGEIGDEMRKLKADLAKDIQASITAAVEKAVDRATKPKK